MVVHLKNTAQTEYDAPEYVSTSDSISDKVDSEAIVKYNYTPVREDEVALTKR